MTNQYTYKTPVGRPNSVTDPKIRVTNQTIKEWLKSEKIITVQLTVKKPKEQNIKDYLKNLDKTLE